MRRNPLELSLQAKLLPVGLAAALWVHSATPTQAHGAKIEALPQAVEIVATFDTGEPMDNAQVAVYAPDAPEAPWQTGQTDGEGRFSFTPEAGIAGGRWEVTVRKAGHGQMISFSLDEDLAAGSRAASTQTATAQSAAQKWLSMVAIVWGFIGTALYFSSRSQSRSARGNGYPKSPGKSTLKPAVESARTVDSRAVDSRATVAAGFGNAGKAAAEESR